MDETKCCSPCLSRQFAHRDLKPDNVLLTATENVKLADLSLAREYIALKRTDARRQDSSWMASYAQYYMTSGVGTMHWMAPEFFRSRYTEKADVFPLGAIFYAILERDFVMIHGKASLRRVQEYSWRRKGRPWLCNGNV